MNKTMQALGSSPSVIRELFAYGLEKAREVGSENVYDYTLGNPSIPSPPAVNQAIHDILQQEDPIAVHGYSMSGGFDATREAVAADLNRRFGTDYGKQDLFLTCGAAPALISVIRALVSDPSDEILGIAPYFPEYKPFVESNGGVFRVVPPDIPDFQIDIAAVEKALSPHTQALILNSPNNPSGVVYTRETLQGLADLLREKTAAFGHPIYIIADEPYRELVYGDVTVPFIPAIYPDTVICYSWSKSLSLPGERIGYVLVPPACTGARDLYFAVAGAARSGGHVCAPTLMQKVIERCAGERPDLEAYDANRTLLYESLTEMGYVCAKPDGAFYLFVQAPGGDGYAFSEAAKRQHNLLVVPGEEFGCPGYMRLSYCVSGEMIRRSLPAFRAMRDSFSES